MKEKNKTILIIIVLILIIILGIICYQLINPQEKLKENREKETSNIQDIQNTEIEQKEIEIQGNKIATKNIQVNGNNAEVKVTMNINDVQQSENKVYTTYNLELKIEINNKIAKEIDNFIIELDSAEELKLGNIVKNVSNFIGEDNKEYIILLIENSNTYTNVYQNYYIIDENANVIAEFKNDRAAGIILDDYSGDYIQVNKNYVAEYEVDENSKTLKKWKNTVNDGKLKKTLEKEYNENEYMQAGKKK